MGTGGQDKKFKPAQGLLFCEVRHIHSYGLYNYGLYSYGLYSYGLCSYGLYRYGLYSYGPYQALLMAKGCARTMTSACGTHRAGMVTRACPL